MQKISYALFLDTLCIPMTVEEYSTQLDELLALYCPQAGLMPGELVHAF